MGGIRTTRGELMQIIALTKGGITCKEISARYQDNAEGKTDGQRYYPPVSLIFQFRQGVRVSKKLLIRSCQKKKRGAAAISETILMR